MNLRQIAGLHLQHNISIDRLRDLNLRNYTVLSESADFIPAIRAIIPDARFCLRMRLSDHWRDHSGEQVAREANSLARAVLTSDDCVTPANEQNIEDWDGVPGRRVYEEIALFSSEFARAWRQLGSPCRIVTPALSPGHSEDQEDWPGVFGYDILRAAWDMYDLIGTHGYWEPVGSVRDPAQARWNALRDVVTYRRFWPNKNCWHGEFNAPSVENNPDLHTYFAADVLYYLQQLAGLGYVEAATYFIDDSINQPYRLVRIPPLMDLFRRIGREVETPPVVIVPPAPAPTAPPEPVPTPDDAAIRQKYNLEGKVHETPEIGIRFEDITNGTVELEALGPRDLEVTVRTLDGQHASVGMGRAALVMATEAKYFPEAGQHGFYAAECAGARVEGLGMKPSHEHPRTIFYRRPAAPPYPGGPDSGGWIGAFADVYRADPSVGEALPEYAYLLVTDGISDSQRPVMQASRDWLLVWDGAKVVRLPRSR